MDKSVDRQALVELLQKKIGVEVQVFEDNTGRSIKVPRSQLPQTMKELRDNEQYKFDYLMNLSSVDYPENFTVVYHLTSMKYKHYLTVKVEISKEEPCWVPSVSSIWKAAQVQEREVYDLMGIIFTDHPDLRRILLPDDFVGHPLRKDFNYEHEDNTGSQTDLRCKT